MGTRKRDVESEACTVFDDSEPATDATPRQDTELWTDVLRGLADVAAGRVVSQKVVREELLRDFSE